jgi:uracil-DNA glycosylase
MAELGRRLSQATDILPPQSDWFAAFIAWSPDDVKVLLLGQDPYHGAGQAHGLAFSVRSGMPDPPSLRNILKELQCEVGGAAPGWGQPGVLSGWASQGVLLLNRVLTVTAGEAGSHQHWGWEALTEAVVAWAVRTRWIAWSALSTPAACVVNSSSDVRVSVRPSRRSQVTMGYLSQQRWRSTP